MEKYLRSERFDQDPSSKATTGWLHWKKTFVNFLAQSEPESKSSEAAKWQETKLQLLVNHISPKVYAYVSECHSYDSAIAELDKLYIKANNIIYARHILTTRRQQQDETVDIYLQSLKQLAKDCEFKSVDAETNKNDSIRGAFIAGMASSKIRSRLLENLSLTLDETYNIALSMETAETNSQNFINPVVNAVPEAQNIIADPQTLTAAATTLLIKTFSTRKCWYCGSSTTCQKELSS